MFSYSTGYYVSPPVDQYLKFKNRCSLLYVFDDQICSVFMSICIFHVSSKLKIHMFGCGLAMNMIYCSVLIVILCLGFEK
jgi:hypothetical protein